MMCKNTALNTFNGGDWLWVKKVYQIKCGLYSNGFSIFTKDQLSEKHLVLNLSQAPIGHPAHLHSRRISRKDKHENVVLLKFKALGNY